MNVLALHRYGRGRIHVSHKMKNKKISSSCILLGLSLPLTLNIIVSGVRSGKEDHIEQMDVGGWSV
jgi:hypothetical protein